MIKEIKKTRKDHECEYCHKTILKGSKAKVYTEDGSKHSYQEGARGGRGGSHYTGKWYHRRYWCIECPTIIKRCKHIFDMTEEEFEKFLNDEEIPWEEEEVK